MTDITTHEALIKDLADIVKSANANEDKLNKAKDSAAKAAENSIRSLAERLGKVNVEFEQQEINAICESVADRIAKGNANVKKARKSELKLCLEQRAIMGRVIEKIDETNEARDGEEGWKPLNLRSATLKALRVARKENATPEAAVGTVVADHTHVKSDAEKAEAHLDALEKSEALKVDGAMPEDIAQHIAALRAALGGAVQEPEEEEAPAAVDHAEELSLSEIEFEPGDANDAEEIERPVEHEEIEVTEPENGADFEDSDFDIESLTRGLL